MLEFLSKAPCRPDCSSSHSSLEVERIEQYVGSSDQDSERTQDQ